MSCLLSTQNSSGLNMRSSRCLGVRRKKSVLGIDNHQPLRFAGERRGQECLTYNVCHEGTWHACKKALLLNLTPCWRSRRNQRAIKEAKSLSWQRKISLVLKLMKMLEEQRQKCWKDEDRETILRSVFKKMEKTNVAR